jgi:hypothetical protein
MILQHTFYRMTGNIPKNLIKVKYSHMKDSLLLVMFEPGNALKSGVEYIFFEKKEQ